MRNSRHILGLVAATMILSSAPGAGQAAANPADQIAQGRAMAQAHCSVCHAVGENDPSPTWVNSNTPFRLLHERYPIAMLEEALVTGRLTGHDEMPGFEFPLDDMAALLGYIDSLAPGKSRYLNKPPQ